MQLHPSQKLGITFLWDSITKRTTGVYNIRNLNEVFSTSKIYSSKNLLKFPLQHQNLHGGSTVQLSGLIGYITVLIEESTKINKYPLDNVRQSSTDRINIPQITRFDHKSKKWDCKRTSSSQIFYRIIACNCTLKRSASAPRTSICTYKVIKIPRLYKKETRVPGKSRICGI